MKDIFNNQVGEVSNFRPIGENVIKSERILNAWREYCMESIIFRILVRIGLRK